MSFEKRETMAEESKREGGRENEKKNKPLEGLFRGEGRKTKAYMRCKRLKVK